MQKKLFQKHCKRLEAEQKIKKAQQETEKILKTVRHKRNPLPKKDLKRFIWMVFSFLVLIISVGIVIHIQSIREPSKEVELIASATKVNQETDLIDRKAAPDSFEVETTDSNKIIKSVELKESLAVIVNNNFDWEPVRRDFNGTIMVLVPKGNFRMGSSEKEIDFALELCEKDLLNCQRSWYEDEAPISILTFDNSFWIDETEVTRSAYKTCVSAGVCNSVPDNDYSAEDNQPINRVTWYQAAAYCEWLGARLPTEVEWEYAARGVNSFIFPWGNKFDGNKLHYSQNSNNETAPVGNYLDGASWVGALDMSGNVWEWTSSLYRDYPYINDDGRRLIGKEKDISEKITLRGGSFVDTASSLRVTHRAWLVADRVGTDLGLRCARSDSDF